MYLRFILLVIVGSAYCSYGDYGGYGSYGGKGKEFGFGGY
ncbi:YjcZ family sporulation protein [Alteribacillus sp. HJP-4]